MEHATTNALPQQQQDLMKTQAERASQWFQTAYWHTMSVPLYGQALVDNTGRGQWGNRRLSMAKFGGWFIKQPLEASIPLAMYVAKQYSQALIAVQQAREVANELLDSQDDIQQVNVDIDQLVKRIMGSWMVITEMAS